MIDLKETYFGFISEAFNDPDGDSPAPFGGNSTAFYGGYDEVRSWADGIAEAGGVAYLGKFGTDVWQIYVKESPPVFERLEAQAPAQGDVMSSHDPMAEGSS